MKIEFTQNEIIFAKKALQEWSCGKLLSIPPDILTILLKLENEEKCLSNKRADRESKEDT